MVICPPEFVLSEFVVVFGMALSYVVELVKQTPLDNI